MNNSQYTSRINITASHESIHDTPHRQIYMTATTPPQQTARVATTATLPAEDTHSSSNSMNNSDYIPFFMQQLNQAETTNGATNTSEQISHSSHSIGRGPTITAHVLQYAIEQERTGISSAIANIHNINRVGVGDETSVVYTSNLRNRISASGNEFCCVNGENTYFFPINGIIIGTKGFIRPTENNIPQSISTGRQPEENNENIYEDIAAIAPNNNAHIHMDFAHSDSSSNSYTMHARTTAPTLPYRPTTLSINYERNMMRCMHGCIQGGHMLPNMVMPQPPAYSEHEIPTGATAATLHVAQPREEARNISIEEQFHHLKNKPEYKNAYYHTLSSRYEEQPVHLFTTQIDDIKELLNRGAYIVESVLHLNGGKVDKTINIAKEYLNNLILELGHISRVCHICNTMIVSDSTARSLISVCTLDNIKTFMHIIGKNQFAKKLKKAKDCNRYKHHPHNFAQKQASKELDLLNNIRLGNINWNDSLEDNKKLIKSAAYQEYPLDIYNRWNVHNI